MSDLKAVFDSLYTNLLLRDLGAKVAPGMAVLVAVRVGTTSVAQTVKDMNEAHLGAWLVAIACAVSIRPPRTFVAVFIVC